MTQIQKDALLAMGNAGAVRIENIWIWREDVRTNEDTVKRVILSLPTTNSRRIHQSWKK